MDFLLHIFNLSWSLHSFPSIWKTSSIISIHKMGKPFDSPASFRPISVLPPASQSFINASFYPVYSSFWNRTPFSFPIRPISVLGDLPSIKLYFVLSSFRMSLTNSGQVLGRFLLRSTSLRLSILSVIPLFFTNLFPQASLLALLVELKLSLLIGALTWFFKITEVALFESVEVFRKDRFLALYLFINELPAFVPSTVSCSMLMI